MNIPKTTSFESVSLGKWCEADIRRRFVYGLVTFGASTAVGVAILQIVFGAPIDEATDVPLVGLAVTGAFEFRQYQYRLANYC